MIAKIHPAFWSHPEVESLDTEAKLACLWLLTNSGTTILGLCKVSNRRFTFETGAQPSALDRAVKAMPHTFQRFGDTIYIRNFIRKQFGSGAQLQRNNVWKSIKSALEAVREDVVRQALCEDYPEFSSTSEAPPKGVQRGTKAQRERERTREREGGLGGEAPTDDEWTLCTAKARIVLGHLGMKSGAKFSESVECLEPIAERLFELQATAEGEDLPTRLRNATDDCKRMVTRCVAVFKGDPVMDKCMTPAHLFGARFHGYLAQRDMPVPPRNGKAEPRFVSGGGNH